MVSRTDTTPPETEPDAPPADEPLAPRRAKGRIRMRILRSTAVMPALFTLLNGLAGFAAIHYVTKDPLGVSLAAGSGALANVKIAAVLIFLAMLCDMLDGRLARMTRTTSDFGAQLDSLCDVISFGVAPAILMLRATVSLLRTVDIDYLPVERVVWAIAGIFMACTVLRLARFNVETDQDESSHMGFRGLPSPGGAAWVASMVLLAVRLIDHDPSWNWLPQDGLLIGMSIALPVLTLVAALLMVSRMPYPHLVNQYIQGHRPFSYLVKLVFLVIFLLLAALQEPYVTLAAAVLVYSLSGPAKVTWTHLRRRKA